MTIYIHAVNVSYGGGKVLLNSIISNSIHKKNIFFHLDKRFIVDAKKLNILYDSFSPSIFGRIYAEYILWKSTTKIDHVICFGNLPPIKRLKASTTLFIQNRLLLESYNFPNFSIKLKTRLFLERVWLKFFYKNADQIIVQTPSMKKLVIDNLSNDIPVKVLTLVGDAYNRKKIKVKKNTLDRDKTFIYVASGEPHKNHKNLIEAWCMLADENIYPTLKLTLDVKRSCDKKVYDWIRAKIDSHRLKVINLGHLSTSGLLKEYLASSALIYPSLFESMGLPLIEARNISLSVIASELDYVRDIVDPVESFNPNSTISIYKAVKRFLKQKSKIVSIHTLDDFLDCDE